VLVTLQLQYPGKVWMAARVATNATVPFPYEIVNAGFYGRIEVRYECTRSCMRHQVTGYSH
jgi:hypothetical protein